MELWNKAPVPFQRYEISTLGRVRTSRGCILKGSVSSRYRRVSLSSEGVKSTFTVHRLVALVFLGEPPEVGMVVHHLNSDPLDNRSSNLEWVTQKEHGSISRRVVGNNSREVLQFDLEGNLIKCWQSIKSIPYDYSRIWLVCKGRAKTAYGFKWVYKESQLSTETWRSIIIDGNTVWVSSEGRVRTGSGRPTWGGGSTYRVVKVQGVKKAVHRLVAMAFLPVPNGVDYRELTVNHKNLDKLDNRSDNLEWVTQSENNQHARDSYPPRQHWHRPVQRLKQDSIVTFSSIKEASAASNVGGSQITMACRGILKTAGGFEWSYLSNTGSTSYEGPRPTRFEKILESSD
jgi:hypothetical protein